MHIFYQPDDGASFLTGVEAQHCLKVLRLLPGTDIQLVNGRGRMETATIRSISRDKVEYSRREGSEEGLLRDYRLHMAVSPTRKAERNEWMVEKMVELGVDAISFVRTEHSHRESFGRMANLERMERVAVAAMKQSRQSRLPEFSVWDDFHAFVAACREEERFLAYVPEQAPSPHLLMQSAGGDVVVLIGPEGDFSPGEIGFALGSGFRAVSLGPTRLRTETAAVAACHAVHLARIRPGEK